MTYRLKNRNLTKDPRQPAVNAKVDSLISELYQAFMQTDEVQKFAHDHPDQQLTMSLEIALQSNNDENCCLTLRDDGYILQSEARTA